MAPKVPLKVGLSPCPNDTFIFGPLIQGYVKASFPYEFVLEDVEALNLRALEGLFPVTKLSFGVLPETLDTYELLPTGAALGYGCGPLLVAKSPQLDLTGARVAVPGLHTTAYLLLRFYAGEVKEIIALRYDEIIPALKNGKADAGLLIHEGRFVYRRHGLYALVDLGKWWEEKTGLPLPLGGIFVRRNLPPKTKTLILEDLRASLHFARENLSRIWDFICQHARELQPEIIQKHIETFVNRFTFELGQEGREAIMAFVNLLEENGLLRERRPLFFEEGKF